MSTFYGDVMSKTFAAQIGDWADRTEDKMLRVAQASIQDVMTIAQTTVAQGGNMPVDTGFLRNSLVSSLDGAEVAQGEDSYTLAIAGMQLGQPMQFAWTAEDYAIPRHYAVGVGQGGGLWRDLAAAQWQDLVTKNAAAVR